MSLRLPPPLPTKEREHLRLISVFSFVVAGMALCAVLILWSNYYIYADMLESRGPAQNPNQSVESFDLVFRTGLWIIAGMSMVLALLNTISGLAIHRRKGRLFSLLVAVPNLLFIPFGTVLGI